MIKKLLTGVILAFTVHTASAQYTCIPTISSVTPVYTNSCGGTNKYYISKVTTTGGTLNILNPTACDNPSTNYSYYSGTGKTLQANAGATVNFKIEYVVPSSSYLQRTAFWIDFNQDKVFNDTYYDAVTNPTGELINTNPLSTGLTPGNPNGFALIIPSQAKHGLTRMRVRSFGYAFGNTGVPTGGVPLPINPCTTTNVSSGPAIPNGETEDYDVFINNPCVKVSGILFKNVTSKGADVQWKPQGNEKQFEYVVDKVRSDPGTGNRYINGATKSMHIPDTVMKYIDCDAKYYFHIRAICDTDSHFPGSYYYGPWTLDSFVTPPCCNTPDISVKNITSYTALASWGPVTSVQAYEYSINVDTIVPTNGTILTNTQVFLNGLQCSKEYHFFLRARCSPTPTSDWGVDSFLTQPCLSIDNTPKLPDFKLNAYPNPVKDVITLSVMHGMKLSDAKITVTDLTGKVLITQVMDEDKTLVDLRDLPSGLYLIKYADEARTQVVKIQKE